MFLFFFEFWHPEGEVKTPEISIRVFFKRNPREGRAFDNTSEHGESLHTRCMGQPDSHHVSIGLFHGSRADLVKRAPSVSHAVILVNQ